MRKFIILVRNFLLFLHSNISPKLDVYLLELLIFSKY